MYTFERNLCNGLDCYRTLTRSDALAMGEGNGTVDEDGNFTSMADNPKMLARTKVLVAYIRGRTLVVVEELPKKVFDHFPTDEYDRIDQPVRKEKDPHVRFVMHRI